MVWEKNPHIVSRGAQKNFKEFGELIVPRWNKNNIEFNDMYFMHAVAKIIIFKTCDKIIYKEPWYGEYKANIVAYTLSTFSYLLEKDELSIDYSKIWKTQDLDPYFKKEIRRISKYINEYIANTPEKITNISEWCKKDACWTKLQRIIDNTDELSLSYDFKKNMIAKKE